MFRIRFQVMAATLALAATPAFAASVTTAWAELPSADQEQCLGIGSEAVQRAGFRASISNDRQTVFGWRGEEALVVRCIAGSGVAVVFAWVHDTSNDGGQLVDIVTGTYRDGRGGNGGGQGGVVKR